MILPISLKYLLELKKKGPQNALKMNLRPGVLNIQSFLVKDCAVIWKCACFKKGDFASFENNPISPCFVSRVIQKERIEGIHR